MRRIKYGYVSSNITCQMRIALPFSCRVHGKDTCLRRNHCWHEYIKNRILGKVVVGDVIIF